MALSNRINMRGGGGEDKPQTIDLLTIPSADITPAFCYNTQDPKFYKVGSGSILFSKLQSGACYITFNDAFFIKSNNASLNITMRKANNYTATISAQVSDDYGATWTTVAGTQSQTISQGIALSSYIGKEIKIRFRLDLSQNVTEQLLCTLATLVR